MRLADSLRQHWPEYLMEAWGLGTFMVSAGIAVSLLEATASPLYGAIPDADVRRAIVGLAMGLTAIGIIYSPWGRRSGAHINPAVTLTFLRLGKIHGWDALFFILAQFTGGVLGILLVWWLLGEPFAQPPVSYVVTVPGAAGPWAAFAAEGLLSFGLMLTLLFLMNASRLEHYTGLAAGMLVATYITLEAPLSGMSINPARTFASAAPAGIWTSAWIYFIAPPLGMLGAVELYRLMRFGTAWMCAKLDHPYDRRCIHCGHDPSPGRRRDKRPGDKVDRET